MTISVRALDVVRDHESIRRFSSTVWPRPVSGSYWSWLLSCPSLIGSIAVDKDNAILAIILGITRRYCVGSSEIDCIETFNWYCLPSQVNSGLGMFVLRDVMKKKRPLVSLGSTAQAEDLHRRAGYTAVAEGFDLWLPMDSNSLVARGRSRLLSVAYANTLGRLRRPRTSKAPAEVHLRFAGTQLPHIRHQADVFPLLDQSLLAWFSSGGPEVGAYLPFSVTVSGNQCIWGLVRVVGPRGSMRAELLEWHSTLHGDENERWAISEIIASLGNLGCSSIHVLTTNESLAKALLELGFRINRRPTALVWSPPGSQHFKGAVHLMGSRGDSGFLVTDRTLPHSMPEPDLK